MLSTHNLSDSTNPHPTTTERVLTATNFPGWAASTCSTCGQNYTTPTTVLKAFYHLTNLYFTTTGTIKCS